MHDDHALGGHNKGKELMHRRAEERCRVHKNLERVHQTRFASPEMEPALIRRGLTLGLATTKVGLRAALKFDRHGGGQWEGKASIR